MSLVSLEGNTVTPINVSQSIVIIISPRASQFWPKLTRHVIPCEAQGRGSRGHFLAPRQWFISLHQNILIESSQLQEQPPQKQRHRKLFRVQIGNLSVVVNNFPSLCSRFVHLWPGQARDKQMCRRDASPVCLLTVVWKSMWWSGFVFMMFGSERGSCHLLLGQSVRLYPERDRCAEAREGGVRVNKWCKT